MPRTRAETVLVERAKELQRTIDTLIAHRRGLTLHLAALTADSQLVGVRDTSAWPDALLESYNVWTDSLGHVVSAIQVPFSESGDWSNVYAYYFDDVGTTAVFKRTSGFFSGCDGGARETSTTYLDHGGRILERDYSITRLNDSTGVDPARCDFTYRYPYDVFTTWRAFAAATGLGKLGLGKVR